MALEAHAAHGQAVVEQAAHEVVVGLRLGLALELNPVVVDVEAGVGVGAVGVDKGRVDVVVAYHLLPYRLAQLVAQRVGADNALVVVEHLVDHVPLAHPALVVAHHAGDVLTHYLEQLGAGVVVVVLVAVGGDPGRGLVVPHERMPAHRHAVALGEVAEAVAVAEVELPAAGLQCVGLHLVLGHHHVEVAEHGLRGLEVVVAHVDAPHRHGHADVLAGQLRVVAQRLLLVGEVVAVVHGHEAYVVHVEVSVL